EGYFQETDPALAGIAAALSAAIERLRERGLPPVFIFLFDEAWLAFFRQHAMLSTFLGADYQVLPDFWAWRIDPAAGQAGWRPHRDKGRNALGPDAAPLSLTMWIPLTPATPQNGCMYILPANRDPVYNTADEKNWRIDYPSIRALPAAPGQYLCWNQAVLHWGAQSSPFAEAPRMSMALEFQRSDIEPFNRPLLGSLPNLAFESRLKLIAKQILQYRHMYPLPAPLQALAQQLLS
ncbi:MAG TPA: phytanoyl-CoA dioxygenase family protein, partial [Phenylobacterium sp.]|nr:phytanoyl-CoA dioxygenase family protein [Phenylobacterium sp.]